jgi:Cys-tRNA(Pro)/Cys-tRNA(Cys) deacylase
MSGRGTPALAALIAAGVAHVVHEYAAPEPGGGRDHDGRPHYGPDAAAALGVEPSRIFKTLVASVDGRLVVGVVPVSGELDLKALATAAGGHRAELARPETAERATGSVIGGISPLGHRRPMPVYVDSRVTGFATIFVSGGRRGLQVELAPGDLVRLAGATLAPIARTVVSRS